MDTTDLNDLHCFVAVFQTGSFTAAAKKLGVSKVAIAKRLGAFEKKLRYPLFRRSTRSLMPTPEGDQLYAQSLQLLQHVQDFERQLSNTTPMEGLVRITCSYSLALTFVSELLVQFQKRHPKLKFELISTDSVLDLVEHNIDLAIRIGTITNHSMVGRKLGENRIVLCASPEYLKKNPAPKSIPDLKKHPCFYMNFHREARFTKGPALKDVLSSPGLITSEGALVKQLGLRSYGLVIRSEWDVKKNLESGDLVRVLPQHEIEPMGSMWLLSSVGRMQSARVRTVFDMIVQETKSLF